MTQRISKGLLFLKYPKTQNIAIVIDEHMHNHLKVLQWGNKSSAGKQSFGAVSDYQITNLYILYVFIHMC